MDDRIRGIGSAIARLAKARGTLAQDRMRAMEQACILVETDVKVNSMSVPRPAPFIIHRRGGKEVVLKRGGVGGLSADSGHLRASVTHEVLPPVEGKVVGVVGTPVFWAGVHEDGATIVPKASPFLFIPVNVQRAGTAARRTAAGKTATVRARANGVIAVREVHIPARRPFGQSLDRTRAGVVKLFDGFVRTVTGAANGSS